MIAITIEYRPLGFLWKRRLETRLPARWSDMTSVQFTFIPDLQRGKLNDSKVLQIFLGIKRSLAKRIDSYQAYCITKYLKYIREPEPLGYFVIDSIAGFRAPGANLKGVTFGAFIFGNSYYTNYINGKKEDLNRFIACYYTDSEGFKDSNIEANARIIGSADIRIREAIAINYGLIREWLALAYPNVFQKVEKKKVVSSKGWVDVFDRLVQNDFGNQDKYAEFPVSSVLRHLNILIGDKNKYGSKVQ